MHHRLALRLPRSRRDLIVVGLVVLVAAAALLPGIAVGARDKAPHRMGEFLWGLAGQESGWDYTARNRSSGAYGKYQIMPANWPHWARTYLDDRWADQSPRNQELVTRAKMAGLHRWLGTWRRVAYWWLTGGTETDERKWSDLARGYVDNVTRLMKRAPAGGDPIPTGPAGDPPVERGHWRLIVEGAPLFEGIRDGRRFGRLRDGQTVFVQGVGWNDDDVLWLKVSTASDRVGWISIRRSVPAGRPENPDRWPKGDRIRDPDDERERERARPRPR